MDKNCKNCSHYYTWTEEYGCELFDCRLNLMEDSEFTDNESLLSTAVDCASYQKINDNFDQLQLEFYCEVKNNE